MSNIKLRRGPSVSTTIVDIDDINGIQFNWRGYPYTAGGTELGYVTQLAYTVWIGSIAVGESYSEISEDNGVTWESLTISADDCFAKLNRILENVPYYAIAGYNNYPVYGYRDTYYTNVNKIKETLHIGYSSRDNTFRNFKPSYTVLFKDNQALSGFRIDREQDLPHFQELVISSIRPTYHFIGKKWFNPTNGQLYIYTE